MQRSDAAAAAVTCQSHLVAPGMLRIRLSPSVCLSVSVVGVSVCQREIQTQRGRAEGGSFRYHSLNIGTCRPSIVFNLQFNSAKKS